MECYLTAFSPSNNLKQTDFYCWPTHGCCKLRNKSNQICFFVKWNGQLGRAGHRKFTLNSTTANSAKLQEVFRNRKSASLRWFCGNSWHFRNRKCTLLFRKLRPQYLLLFCSRNDLFYFWRSNFAVVHTLTSKKKNVINTPTSTSNSENKSVHFFQAFYRGTGDTAYCFADLR